MTARKEIEELQNKGIFKAVQTLKGTHIIPLKCVFPINLTRMDTFYNYINKYVQSRQLLLLITNHIPNRYNMGKVILPRCFTAKLYHRSSTERNALFENTHLNIVRAEARRVYHQATAKGHRS